MILEARGLALDLANRQVLKDINIAVNPGQFTCITGPSGSGKSSLLHCLSGLLLPSRGEVHARGQRLDLMTESARARYRLRHFGFVFQFAELLPELTLQENVELPLRLLGDFSPRASARVDDLLERLHIASVRNQSPLTVSGGEAQRAAIARALVHRPDVIFADEPTGALDRNNGQRVLAALQELVTRDNVAVVMVTHDESMASAANQRVALLDGSADDLFATAT